MRNDLCVSALTVETHKVYGVFYDCFNKFFIWTLFEHFQKYFFGVVLLHQNLYFQHPPSRPEQVDPTLVPRGLPSFLRLTFFYRKIQIVFIIQYFIIILYSYTRFTGFSTTASSMRKIARSSLTWSSLSVRNTSRCV